MMCKQAFGHTTRVIVGASHVTVSAGAMSGGRYMRRVSYDRENIAAVVQRGLVLHGDRPAVDKLCNSTWPLVTSRQRRHGVARDGGAMPLSSQGSVDAPLLSAALWVRVDIFRCDHVASQIASQHAI